MQAQAAAIFAQKYGRLAQGVARAPGRVNLLGEHVDYNDGWVLPAAIDRATYVAFGPIDGDECAIWAEDFQQEALFKTTGGTDQRSSLSEWAHYPAGVAWSLRERGLEVKSIQAVVISDVPRGAGLSSSASVELAFATAWKAVAGWDLPPMQLALICQRAENQYVGVNCGIMDQATSACGEAGRLLVLDCRELTYETLPLPESARIVIADTGVRHSLTTGAYNARRAACEQAVRLLHWELAQRPKALRDVSVQDLDRLRHLLPPEVARRARHVVEEIERTRKAIPLLRKGKLVEFGKLMNDCHRSLRDLYEVSCPELDAMVRIAQSLPGCYGARLTGAGFGGCTVNLVQRRSAERFGRDLAALYERETGRAAEIHICRASAGASLV